MRTFDELERLWASLPARPPSAGTVRLICVRKGGGVHECPDRVEVSVASGVEGDRWKAALLRRSAAQVTVMDLRVTSLVSGVHAPLDAAGDNFLVDLELSEAALPAGSQLCIGGARLEVTSHPHLGCQRFSDRFGEEALRWVNAVPHRPRRLRGVNCQVISDGLVTLGDAVTVVRSARP
jgi:MOSC domain-containing protein